MKVDGLQVPEAEIGTFCRQHHIRRLALFGSATRGELRPESDLDILVEFEEGHTPGFRFFRIQEELSGLLGRQVDLNTPQFLSPRVRGRALAQAAVLYDRA